MIRLRVIAFTFLTALALTAQPIESAVLEPTAAPVSTPAPTSTPTPSPLPETQARPEPKRPRGGWFLLRWMEKPSKHGPSAKAAPEDRGKFDKVLAYDPEEGQETFHKAIASLHEGDMIAYRLSAWEARKGILMGGLNKVGYRILEYGHLAILVEDPKLPGHLRVFSSESFKGPNLQEGLDTLQKHRWDVYRLNKADRMDRVRLREFRDIAIKKAGHWYGYDFVGMFGLWNTPLAPDKPRQVRHTYICSTVVAAALHYAKVNVDAVNRKGVLDLVSPKQVVTSRCRLMKAAPEASFEIQEVPNEEEKLLGAVPPAQ